MEVTILGAGNMGRGIGSRLLAGGHDVRVLDRDPEEADRLADELRGAADDGASAEGGAAGDPISGDVVVLAVYYDSAQSVVEQYGDQLDGKVVVDITNPVNETFDDLVTPPDSSAAEELAKRGPGGARLVKAFNTTFGRAAVPLPERRAAPRRRLPATRRAR